MVAGLDLPSPAPQLTPAENKRKKELEKEKMRLQNMDEEEYDALSEEEKNRFDREIQQVLRERKKRWAPRAGQTEAAPLGGAAGETGHILSSGHLGGGQR